MAQSPPIYRPHGKPAGPMYQSPDRYRVYDQTRRDKSADRFYHSREWLALRKIKLARNPLCEHCEAAGRTTPGRQIHHCKPLRDFPEHALDMANLQTLCDSCHAKHEARISRPVRRSV